MYSDHVSLSLLSLQHELHEEGLDESGLIGHRVLAGVDRNRLAEMKMLTSQNKCILVNNNVDRNRLCRNRNVNKSELMHSHLQWLLYDSFDIPTIYLTVVKKLDTFLEKRKGCNIFFLVL